jgi:dTDP-4-amino-4,6-dideoxygalactose transaminase
VTDDDDLAGRMRLMRNFGFEGYDRVIYPGTNGKMSEICAAMGLTSLDALDRFITVNRGHYHLYRSELAGLPGIKLFAYDESEKRNYQYIVLEVDPAEAGLNRDELIAVLLAENVNARRYFWPGCHRMEPYCSYYPNSHLLLPETEQFASRVLSLPTGAALHEDQIRTIASIVKAALAGQEAIGAFLRQASGRASFADPLAAAAIPLNFTLAPAGRRNAEPFYELP